MAEAARWMRTTLNMGTGPGQVPGKVQFKLVTTDAGGVDGVRQCTFKDSDQLDAGRFRWTSTRGTSWDQVSAWGAEWRRAQALLPHTFCQQSCQLCFTILLYILLLLAWYEGCPSNELVERGGEERGEEGEGGRSTGPEGPCHRSVRLRATALNATRPSYNGRPQGIHSLLSKGHGSDS